MSRLLRWGTGGTWGLLVGATLMLLALHAQIDNLLDYSRHDIIDHERFEPLHERYELLATFQWGAGLVHLWCVLAVWRRADASSAGKPAALR
jgi:hypothetical protein